MCRHVDQKIFNEAGDEVQKSIVKKKRETCLLDYVRYIAKRFVTFLGQQSPCLDKLQKVFNKYTVKVSCCCTKNVAIIKTCNKKLVNTGTKCASSCNCR